MNGVPSQVTQPTRRDTEGVQNPLSAQVRRQSERQQSAAERGPFSEGAPSQRCGAGADGSAEDSAEGNSFGRFVERHRERHGDTESEGHGQLGGSYAPAVEKAMQRSGGDQGGRESVQLSGAGVVVVVMCAGRADGISESVDQEQEAVTGDKQGDAPAPSDLGNQLREESENSHSQHYTGAERYEDPGLMPQAG